MTRYNRYARYFADRYIWYLENGSMCVNQVMIHISRSHKHPLVKQRAAKRFGRLRRKHHIEETADSRQLWYQWRTSSDPFYEVLTGDYHSY